MTHSSVIEISEKALKNNLKFIRHVVGDGCRISCVLKGNAYGHGIDVYAPLLNECGIDHISVFNAEEAYRVFKSTDRKSEIMIMGMIDDSAMNWVVENDISFFVFNLDRLKKALTASKMVGRPARIHIELETGLNRTGFVRKELKSVIRLISGCPENFIVEGVCTHYAGAESIANYKRIQRQIRMFKSESKWLKDQQLDYKLRHSACSAAAMSYPTTRMDMVRIGIMQYGYWPSKETYISYLNRRPEKGDPLQRVISWKTQVMTTKSVRAGEFIGYGTTYMAESDMRIAIVPVGYSEGYSRSLSNQGRVLIRGNRVNVVGLVNMNMLVADITNVPDAGIGDEVVLIGNQGDQDVSVASFSELSNQLNYELLTRLPQNIRRVVTE